MINQNIALVFGGVSSEHDVSIKSFETIYNAIKESKILSKTLKKIFYITRDANVITSNIDFAKNPKEYYKSNEKEKLEKLFSIALEENLFLFSTIHGQYGEDGSLQGAAKFFGIKNNFGSILSTSISMSKYHLNRYLDGQIAELNIPQTLQISTIDDIEKIKEFENQQIIIKPNSLGSSLFTEKFLCTNENMKDIIDLINNILEFDEKALIQEFIKGEEYSCGCLEKSKDVLVLPIVKIITDEDFFSHKAKYTKGNSINNVILLENETEIEKKLKRISFEIFKELEFNAMVRFDYIIKNEKIYFLEANTLPGLKSSSIYPSMLKEYNINLEELITILIDNELNRDEKQTQLIYCVS